LSFIEEDQLLRSPTHTADALLMTEIAPAAILAAAIQLVRHLMPASDQRPIVTQVVEALMAEPGDDH
jgi:hypothetical protein